MIGPLRCVLVLGLVLAIPSAALAQEAWVRVTSPNFTVITNARERDGRRIATQFERIRSAITGTFPWAKAQLDRPVVVLGARDEATMKRLVPRYWEPGSQVKPSSVLSTGPDTHFIALRVDVQGEDTPDQSPYQAAYWSYAALALETGFEVRMPLWFRNGLAGLLSNSIVRDNRVEFGRQFAPYIRMLNNEPRLKTTELMNITADSSYYREAISRQRFDAQSWAIAHYLLFGDGKPNAVALNRIVELIGQGRTSQDAIATVYGSVEAFEQGYLNYFRRPLLVYAVVETQISVAESAYTFERLAPATAQATEIGMHVAMGNAAGARTLISAAERQPPVAAAVFDAEGVLLDREDKDDEARLSYSKAADAASTSFYTLYRLAVLEWSASADAAALTRRQGLLTRAITANPRFGPAHSMLADTFLSARQYAEAIAPARSGVTLQPASVSARLVLARALWATDQRGDARGMALGARALADSDDERRQVQSVLDFFDRASQPTAGTGPAGSTSTAPSAAAAAPGRPAAATAAAAGTTAAPRMILDLRDAGPGETKVLGTFQEVECAAGAVALVIQADGRTLRATARQLNEVEFITFRSDTPGAVNCGRLPRPLRAVLTYRPNASPTPQSSGVAVAIELVPDDFVPGQ